jgi:predicted neuraminidase
MLRGAAGIGAAGLVAGVFAGAVAKPADAATTAPTDDARSVTHDKPLTVHIHDARNGVVDVYTGEEHVRFTDHQLAARIARAAG